MLHEDDLTDGIHGTAAVRSVRLRSNVPSVHARRRGEHSVSLMNKNRVTLMLLVVDGLRSYCLPFGGAEPILRGLHGGIDCVRRHV